MPGAICKMSVFSKSLGYQTDIHAFIPVGELEPGQKYQVLYLFHGGHGDDLDYLQFTTLDQLSAKHKLVMIMPDCQNSYYQDMYRGSDFFTYILEELPAICQRIFPISRKRENTFAGGVSMGGYGAVRAAFTAPERYARAISIAGAVDFPSGMYESINHLVWNPFKPYSLNQDPEHVEGTSSDLVALARRLKEKNIPIPPLFVRTGINDIFCHHMIMNIKQPLEELGVSMDYQEATEGHHWDFWAKCLPEAIRWLPLANHAVEG